MPSQGRWSRSGERRTNVQAAVATGVVMPQNRTPGAILQGLGLKFKNILGGAAYPQTPGLSLRAPRAYSFTTYQYHSSPAGPVQMSFRRPC